MTSDDPWRGLVAPNASQFHGRRVREAERWDFFWAVDAELGLLLVLEHGRPVSPSRRLPKLRGLKVGARFSQSGTKGWVFVRLTDRDQKDIFLRFCRDLVEATEEARSDEDAVDRFLARTWRWHRLLEGGRDRRLGEDAQRGVIGELIVLDSHLLPVLARDDAVRAWTGPLGAVHDFEVGAVHMEAKASGGSKASVKISSEHQLDGAGADRLFLHVAEVLAVADDTPGAFTLTRFAASIRDRLARGDGFAVGAFEDRLCATGFDWADDYSDRWWLAGRKTLYEVRDGFPRVIPATIPVGVARVRYEISLDECHGFLVTPASLPIGPSGGTRDS